MKRINATLIVALLTICVFASGCVYIRSAAISDRAGAGAPITGTASDYGYLELIAPVGLTQAAFANMLGSCATGKVTGVTSELEVRDFFVVQYYSVSATGSCG